MNKTILTTLLLVFLVLCAEGRKTSKSRSSGSGRSSSRKSNSQPAPTSFSNPQPSAPKPSLFGWQEKPAQRKQTPSRQSSPSGSKTHSYPSSQTGLSGNNNQAKQASSSNQDSVQKSYAPQSTNSKPNHGYPASNGQSGSGGYPPSNGLSGQSSASGNRYPAQESIQRSNAGTSHSYPASNGLSGNSAAGSGHGQGSGYGPGAAPPPYSAPGSAPHSYQSSGVAPPPYSGYKPGGNYGANNYGNYHHPQGPPPPYSNAGAQYGGYGGPGFNGYGSQMPGYFGNYGNRGFGGASRTSTALKGVGIAGAGVGTLLTGLALWNLARSTGHHQHTVIYDNRGQPVAVAPNNTTEPVVDPILGDLVNCSLTIRSPDATEVLGIPCAIATSFTPDADVKENSQDANDKDKTECIVTVVTKVGREFMTTIPCSILLKTAAENNVTEPPELPNNNGTDIVNESVTATNQPSALMLSGAANDSNISSNCTTKPGDVRDPINPCFSVTHDLTVVPLISSDITPSTPGVA